MPRWIDEPIVLARHCACVWRPAEDAVDDDPDTWFDRDAERCPLHMNLAADELEARNAS